MAVIKFTKEDKILFKNEVKTANPIELLALSQFIGQINLSKTDKKFCFSCIGKRCEKLLRNVVENKTFND